MKKDSYYRHPEFMDVFFHVLDITEKMGGYNLKVVWWNKGQCGVPYPINTGNQEFFITKAKADEMWEVFI